MTRYAAATTVTAEKSRAEIERSLVRYGADGFMYGWEGNRATVAFRMEGKMIKFLLEMPDKDSDEFKRTPVRGEWRSDAAALKAWEQATRQRWRALALLIKAKLEAVESGITIFEEEFMPHVVLPDGNTVGNFMLPQIAAAYASGRMPALLPETAEGS
jgi:hypothetical protein